MWIIFKSTVLYSFSPPLSVCINIPSSSLPSVANGICMFPAALGPHLVAIPLQTHPCLLWLIHPFFGCGSLHLWRQWKAVLQAVSSRGLDFNGTKEKMIAKNSCWVELMILGLHIMGGKTKCTLDSQILLFPIPKNWISHNKNGMLCPEWEVGIRSFTLEKGM